MQNVTCTDISQIKQIQGNHLIKTNLRIEKKNILSVAWNVLVLHLCNFYTCV